MNKDEQIQELRKCLIYMIDLYFGPKWRDIKKDQYPITYHKLDEARKILLITG